MLAEASEL